MAKEHEWRIDESVGVADAATIWMPHKVKRIRTKAYDWRAIRSSCFCSTDVVGHPPIHALNTLTIYWLAFLRQTAIVNLRAPKRKSKTSTCFRRNSYCCLQTIPVFGPPSTIHISQSKSATRNESEREREKKRKEEENFSSDRNEKPLNYRAQRNNAYLLRVFAYFRSSCVRWMCAFARKYLRCFRSVLIL